jgi:hypothetical protein
MPRVMMETKGKSAHKKSLRRFLSMARIITEGGIYIG